MKNKQVLSVSLLLAGLATALPLLAQAPPVQFTKIQVRHYDAGMMADLITRPGGIIVVPPNFVIAAAKQPPANASTAANPVLPPGIQKIYVLESNNSLVIQTAP